MKIYFFSLLFMFCSDLFAENRIVYLGAGGEEEGTKTTIFDGGAKIFAKFNERVKNNYKTAVAFDGGHSESEKIVKYDFKNADFKGSFSAENYNKTISDIIKKIKSNPPKISANDKVMVFIDTHGAEKEPNQKTHSVSLAGAQIKSFNSGSLPEESINLDSLSELASLAKEKNIKLAIIDGSCHSGNTLKLANDNTCVISGSLPNQYATDFTEFLAKKFQPGKSIEQAFIEARLEADGTPFPMISSPYGKKVQEDFAVFFPYLYYHNEQEGLDKIDHYLEINSTQNLMCKREHEFKELNNILKFYSKFRDEHNEIFIDFDVRELKSNIEKYKTIQDKYLSKFNSFESINTELDTKINYSVGNSSIEYTNRELLKTNFKELVDNAKADAGKTRDRGQKKTYFEYAALYSKCDQAKNNLLKMNSFKSYSSTIEDIKHDEELSENIAAKIGLELKKVYQAYYKFLQKNSNLGKNPCADFVI